MVDAYEVTCPKCGFTGGERTDFEMSCADECQCPKCKADFILQFDDEDDDVLATAD